MQFYSSNQEFKTYQQELIKCTSIMPKHVFDPSEQLNQQLIMFQLENLKLNKI